MPDSGGHGRWRGGCTIASVWVGHRTEHSTVASGGLIKSVTQGHGLAGGHPATGGYQWHATDTEIQQWFATGRMPTGPDALRVLAPHGGLAEPKRYDNRLGVDDVFEVLPNPGAGFGDPIERDPALVAADLAQSRVSLDDARRLYGVVVDGNGALDAAAIAVVREAIRDERRERSRAPRHASDAPVEKSPPRMKTRGISSRESSSTPTPSTRSAAKHADTRSASAHAATACRMPGARDSTRRSWAVLHRSRA